MGNKSFSRILSKIKESLITGKKKDQKAKVLSDSEVTISQIRSKIQSFSASRGWCENENAKDLVMALSIEAAELMEIFQWIHSDKADNIKDDEKEFVHLKEEIADVFWYLVRICEHFQIDLVQAVEDKAEKNAFKYPIKELLNQDYP